MHETKLNYLLSMKVSFLKINIFPQISLIFFDDQITDQYEFQNFSSNQISNGLGAQIFGPYL